jgi:hypothetical protein
MLYKWSALKSKFSTSKYDREAENSRPELAARVHPDLRASHGG